MCDSVSVGISTFMIYLMPFSSRKFVRVKECMEPKNMWLSSLWGMSASLSCSRIVMLYFLPKEKKRQRKNVVYLAMLYCSIMANEKIAALDVHINKFKRTHCKQERKDTCKQKLCSKGRKRTRKKKFFQSKLERTSSQIKKKKPWKRE